MKRSYRLGILCLVALVLRLVYVGSLDRIGPYEAESADSSWYLASGYLLVTGENRSTYVLDVSQLAPPPVYLIVIGTAQALFPQADAILAIRIFQALLSAATVFLAFRLAWRLTGQERAGWIAAIVLTVAPVFILETGQISTETVYIFLVTAALTVFVEWAARGPESPRWVGPLALAGALLGLATLTRAVLLLFPLGLALYLFLAWSWRRALARAVWLVLVYAVVVSTWTVYNLVLWDRLVIGGDGFAAFLYIGATGWDGPEAVDERLAADTEGELNTDATAPERQNAYMDAARNAISDDIPGYVRYRLSELGRSYLQPHGTALFPGESLRDIAATWLREDRTLAGLVRLAQGDAFWPKLVLYVFHYTALVGGLAGMWLYRRRWRVALPLIGFIVYTSLVHLVLLALPRYIFPTEVVWWVFAAAALARVTLRQSQTAPTLALQAESDPR